MFPLKTCFNLLRTGSSRVFSVAPASTPLIGIQAVRNFSWVVNNAIKSPSSMLSSTTFPALTVQGSTPNLGVGACTPSTSPVGIFFTQVRCKKTFNNWPRPREHKRLRMGWKYRLATKGGRAIIMRRILKGRHILTH